MLTRFIRLAGLFLLLTAAVQRSPVERVVAVGDVHGNLEGFTAVLKMSGLIDDQGQWTGGRTTLVQLGDLIDRGPKSRAVLDFVIALQPEASRRGGSVRVSLGNHEVMNLIGDMRYVVAADYEAFADNRSEQRRRAAFRDYSSLAARKGRMVVEADWMKAHPAGFMEHREAFSPQGKYGKWLRTLPAVNRVDDSVFLHGGINPALAIKTIDQLNSGVKAEIQLFDRVTKYLVDRGLALPFFTLEEFVQAAQDEADRIKSTPSAQTPETGAQLQVLEGLLQAANWLTIHDDGPLWFRGYDRWTDSEGEPQITRLNQTLGTKRIVVAHTPQANGEIRQRFGGQVFLVDTGMILGRLSALEIANGRVRALYPNKQTDFN